MQREKILVVDDEREIGELIRDYLEREGFEVILAPDGQDGLAKLRREKPVMAVLDIMLPKLDGMELCRIVRNESTIPILMLSARKSDVDKILGLGLGADDYVTKPFSPAELVARVRRKSGVTPCCPRPLKPKESSVTAGLNWTAKATVFFFPGRRSTCRQKNSKYSII